MPGSSQAVKRVGVQAHEVLALRSVEPGQTGLGRNVAEVPRKGDSVVAYGEIETRDFTTKEGEKRSVDQVRIETIGKDLRWHTGAGDLAAAPSTTTSDGWGGQPAADPWGATAGQQDATE